MIDSHLHLQNCFDQESSDSLMSELRRVGVSQLMVNATSPGDWNEVKRLSLEYPEVIPSFGVHPWKVENLSSKWLSDLSNLLEAFPHACVGEIGLDKWIPDHDLPLQKEVLGRQLRLAAELNRPVTVHCLRAWGSLIDCFEESPYRSSFLLHSYGGPQEMVNEWVKRGAYFSLSGYFFRKDKTAKLSVFESIPPDRILLETDAPDMAFGKELARYHREGLGNHPANLEVVYESYARWSGSSLSKVKESIRENFERFLSSDQEPAA